MSQTTGAIHTSAHEEEQDYAEALCQVSVKQHMHVSNWGTVLLSNIYVVNVWKCANINITLRKALSP